MKASNIMKASNNNMKSYIDNNSMLERVSEINNAIVETLGWKDMELDDNHKEALKKMVDYLNDEKYDVEEIKADIVVNYEKVGLCRLYNRVRRLKTKDIPWIKLWKRCYKGESDEDVKFSLLKWGVSDLVQADMRRFEGFYGFMNARKSFEEINSNYAEILGVGVEKVSEAIDRLVEQGFVRKRKEGDEVCYISSSLYNCLDMFLDDVMISEDELWITE